MPRDLSMLLQNDLLSVISISSTLSIPHAFVIGTAKWMLENMYFKIHHTINTSHPRVHFISPYSSSAPTEHTHPPFFSYPFKFMWIFGGEKVRGGVVNFRDSWQLSKDTLSKTHQNCQIEIFKVFTPNDNTHIYLHMPAKHLQGVATQHQGSHKWTRNRCLTDTLYTHGRQPGFIHQCGKIILFRVSQVHSAKANNEGGVPAAYVVWTLQGKMALSLYYPKKHPTPKDNWQSEQ